MLCSAFTPVQAQYVPRDERGEREAERKSVIDANRVALTVFNYGLAGGIGEIRGNWPQGSGDFYLGDFQLIVGAEVMDDNGATVRNVLTSRGPRPGADGPPGQSSVFWGFEAVPSYHSETGTEWARSDDASTWPDLWPDRLGDASDPGWPNAWNGLLGKDTFIDGIELYSHYADNLDEEFDYTPDPENPERGGLGLVVSQRVLAWSDPLLEDAVVYVYDIYNASPKPLDTAALGFVLGTLAGGDGDAQDDIADYDFDRDVGYWLDFDNSGDQNQPVGTAGLALLQTPTPEPGGPPEAEVGMTGLYWFTPPGAVRMNDDERLFEIITRDGPNDEDIESCESGGGCDGDLIVSAGPFSLPAFSSQRVVAALVFGEDRTAAEAQIDILRGFVRNGFALDGDLPVSITAPEEGQVVDGAVGVEWTAGGDDLRVQIDYSRDFGATWVPVATDEANDGSYAWFTGGLSTGVYQVRVTAYGLAGVGSAVSGRFQIDRAGNAEPQIVIEAPPAGIVSGVFPIQWIADDADGDDLSVDLYYRTADAPWTSIADGLDAEGEVAWDTRSLPNAPTYQLRANASDGAGITSYTTTPFAVENERSDLAVPPTFEGAGTGDFIVQVVDSEALTGHTYRAEFTRQSGETTYTVTDVTTSSTLLAGVPIPGDGSEGPIFDGLRLVVVDDEAAVDLTGSGWDDPEGLVDLLATRININQVIPGQVWQFQGTAVPYDYEVRFSKDLVGQSIGGFTLGTGSGAPEAVETTTNFTLHNTTLDRPAPFAFFEPAEASRNGRFDAFEFIFLYEDLDGEPNPVPTYVARPATSFPGGAFPDDGDVFALRTFKPFETGDAFTFVASLTVDAEGGAMPRGVRLAAFPNPARGTATVTYEVGQAGGVTLSVYDVLGREVAVLIDGERTVGAYTARFETRGLASGVYILRLESDGQTRTQRVTVLR